MADESYSALTEAAHYPQETNDEYVRGEATAEMILDGVVARVTLGVMTGAFLCGLAYVLGAFGREATYSPIGEETVYIGSEEV